MTPKAVRFVAEYLLDLNATQAAIRAGYSARTARAAGCRLLTKVDVLEAIQAAQAKRSAETGIDAAWVLRTLAEEKTADLASIYDAEGRLLPVPEWPMVFRRGLVVGVESFEEYAGTGPDRVAVGMVRKVKLSDRIKHIELIGRHVGVQAFKDRAEHSGPNGGPIPVAAMIATPEEFARIAAEVAGNV